LASRLANAQTVNTNSIRPIVASARRSLASRGP
jgi:hypothetical protein